MFKGVLPGLVLAGVLATGGAAAQDEGEPSLTTATYDAWTVRCATVVQQGEEDARPVCEIVQTARLRNTGQTVLETAIGRLAEDEPFRLVFKVPVSVWLRAPVAVTIDDEDTGPLTLEASYARCSAQACIADMEIDDAEIDRLLTSDSVAVSFADAAQKPIRIPLTMRGLASAFSATFAPADG